MDKLIKNIDHKTVLPIKDEVTYQKGQIVSKTLAQNENHSLTLFAFDKDEEISTHESGGDAMVVALDGVGKITIVMPSKKPHAVFAQERFKMLLIVMFPENQK